MLPTCITPLPLTLTQKLSDYEFLCFVISKMNEIISHFNEIDEIIDEKTKAMKDEIYAHVNQQLETNNAEINRKFIAFQEQINLQISQFTNEVNRRLSEMDVTISKAIDDLNTTLAEQTKLIYKIIGDNNTWVREYVYSEIFKLKQELKCDIFPVINPITQERDSLQNVLNMLYEDLRYGALTANEYDFLFLTAEEFDNKGLTAYQYDLEAKFIFSERNNMMFSPFNGNYVPEYAVIYDLAELHQNNLTATGFDNLSLTTETFDSKNITAHDFDWEGITEV